MYFCKNCGEAYMTDEAVLCVKCGVYKGQGNHYCHNCGKPLYSGENVCMTCGVPAYSNVSKKSRIAAGLFGIFLGQFGVHNFYLGFQSKAITQLVLTIIGYVTTCVGVGVLLLAVTSIWGVVDGILLLAGKYTTDGKGIPLLD